MLSLEGDNRRHPIIEPKKDEVHIISTQHLSAIGIEVDINKYREKTKNGGYYALYAQVPGNDQLKLCDSSDFAEMNRLSGSEILLKVSEIAEIAKKSEAIIVINWTRYIQQKTQCLLDEFADIGINPDLNPQHHEFTRTDAVRIMREKNSFKNRMKNIFTRGSKA